MGKQAKLKKYRKALKDESTVQKLDKALEIAEQQLTSFNVPSTTKNIEALLKYLASVKRTENITDDEFEALLEEKMSDFIENNLK